MKKFTEVGFLSNELSEWIAQTRMEFKTEFDAADRINRLAMRILFDLPAEDMTDAHMLTNLCFGRALQSFQGVILLAERGALVDARALLRSCTESVIAISALKADPTMPEQMCEEHDLHRQKLANALLNTGDATEILSKDAANELRRTIAEIKSKYGDRGPRGINWEAKAKSGGTVNLYTMAYRLASGDGVHSTLLSLGRYLSEGIGNVQPTFRFHPDKSDLDSTLFEACSAMLHALGLVTDWFGLPEHHDELKACIEGWKQMRAEGTNE